jgi:hypothetical protein
VPGDFDLSSAIASRLPWMTNELGLRLIHVEKDPSSFGDSIALFSSDSMEVRFICERGEVFVELAPPGSSEWWDLAFLCGIIPGCAGDREFSVIGSTSGIPYLMPGEPKLVALGSLLRKNFSEFKRALGPALPETRLKMAKVRDARDLRTPCPTQPRAKAGPFTTVRSSPLGRLLLRLLGWALILSFVWFASHWRLGT